MRRGCIRQRRRRPKKKIARRRACMSTGSEVVRGGGGVVDVVVVVGRLDGYVSSYCYILYMCPHATIYCICPRRYGGGGGE